MAAAGEILLRSSECDFFQGGFFIHSSLYVEGRHYSIARRFLHVSSRS
jgi:hypothetical protein